MTHKHNSSRNSPGGVSSLGEAWYGRVPRLPGAIRQRHWQISSFAAIIVMLGLLFVVVDPRPALSQGVHLVKVDVSVVGHAYRASKLIGASVGRQIAAADVLAAILLAGFQRVDPCRDCRPLVETRSLAIAVARAAGDERASGAARLRSDWRHVDDARRQERAAAVGTNRCGRAKGSGNGAASWNR